MLQQSATLTVAHKCIYRCRIIIGARKEYYLNNINQCRRTYLFVVYLTLTTLSWLLRLFALSHLGPEPQLL
jgi:hypothetical protein